jgi:glucosamine 6-phosphate synthetase-like amidotransferase/phosphosugar isomerase protein
VFAYMAHGKKETALVDRLAEVRGNAALLWLRSYDKQQRLYAVRLTNSPLWFGQTKKGSIVFASTEAILKETAKRCKLVFEYMYEMKQGEHIMAQDCNIKHMTQVKVVAPVYVPAHNYNKPSRFAQQQSIAQAQLDALWDDDDLLLTTDDFDYGAEQNEYNSLRDALDRQFRMGKYGERW